MGQANVPQTERNPKHDLEERLIAFAAMVTDVVEALPNTRAGNHIGGQLIRSGTAPASIYGEAQAAESRRDFIHKMKVALKELRESRVWLLLAKRRDLVTPTSLLDSTLKECDELISIFVASVNTAEGRRTKAKGS